MRFAIRSKFFALLITAVTFTAFCVAALAAPNPTFLYIRNVKAGDSYMHQQTALKFAKLGDADVIFYHAENGLRAIARVGVVDRGPVDGHHPDLQGVMKSAVLSPAPASAPREALSSHGMKVTGIIAARAFNRIGIRGVAGTHTDIHYRSVHNDVQAVDALYGLANSGVDVINVSLGITTDCHDSPRGEKEKNPLRWLFPLKGHPLIPVPDLPTESGFEFKSTYVPQPLIPMTAPTKAQCPLPLIFGPSFKDVLRHLVMKKNVLVVLAAGNGQAYLPAVQEDFMRGVLVVGAMNDRKRVAEYSSRGPGVSLFAPDFGIWSLTESEPPHSGTHEYSEAGHGTSLTAPLVTGAAALAISYLKTHGVTYNVADLRQLILQSAESQAALKDQGERPASLNYKNLAQALKTFVELAKK